MKQIHILISSFILCALLAACSGDDGGSELSYRVLGNAGQATVTYTTETGGSEETAVIPPWETNFSIGGSFGFALRVDNAGETGSVTCEVWINGELVGAVSGQQFADCTGSFSGDRNSSTTSFISNSGDFETAVVAATAVVEPSPTPTMAATEELPTATPTPTPDLDQAGGDEQDTPLAPASSISISGLPYIAGPNFLANMVLSPDGTQIATSQLSIIQIWQFDSEAEDTPLIELQQLRPPTTRDIRSLSWSPDGAIIASGSGDGVWLWDAATGSLIAELPHEGGAESLTWSPDGRVLASSSRGGVVRLWDATNGWQQIQILTEIQSPIEVVVWSPDGTLIASTEQSLVHLWDAATGEEVQTLEGHTDEVLSLDWSPDGQSLATTSQDKTIRIWDAATGAMQFKLSPGTPQFSVDWSPDGTILASGDDAGDVHFWDAMGGEYLQTFRGFASYVTDLAWFPEGDMLAYASRISHTISVWRIQVERSAPQSEQTGGDEQETAPVSVKTASVSETAALSDIYGLNNVALSPDGTQLATSEVSGVRLWQFEPDAVDAPLQELHLLSAPTEKRIESLIWSLDGAIVIGGSIDGVWVWDAATGSMIGELPHEYGARSFSWSPDGRILASSSNDGYVRLWDATNDWQQIRILTEIQDTIREVAWSPNGTLIASTEQYIVHLWDANTGEEVRTLEGHTDKVGNLAWSPDGQRLATSSDDRTIKIWDAAAGTVQLVLEHASYITDIAWSPDGAILVSGTGDDEVHLWDAQSGENLLTFIGLSDSITDLDWSSDGAFLAAASLYKSAARVWRVQVEE